jgi:hypothetical protein
MNEIRFEALPYDEDAVLRLLISASNSGYSGVAEVYVNAQAVADFASGLVAFPASISDGVVFEYGSESGEFPYHLRLHAQAIDGVGHSAICVRVASFASVREAANAEFRVLSEPASINDFGRAITRWLGSPSAPLVWRPRA